MWMIIIFGGLLIFGSIASKDTPQQQWGKREIITYHHEPVPAMCEDVIGEHR